MIQSVSTVVITHLKTDKKKPKKNTIIYPFFIQKIEKKNLIFVMIGNDRQNEINALFKMYYNTLHIYIRMHIDNDEINTLM